MPKLGHNTSKTLLLEHIAKHAQAIGANVQDNYI